MTNAAGDVRAAIPSELSAAQREDDVDGGFYFDGLVIEEIGAVAPGLHGFDGCLAEHGRTAEDAEVFYVARGGDGSDENDFAGDTCGAGDDWVGRIGFGEDHAFGNAGRDSHAVRCVGFDYGGFGSLEDVWREACTVINAICAG